ncbi:hypothetical protein AN641_04410 [Candidatus Epulonipiscioides gigas]|nr:hypothetical protein AN641_04410 [Epulopiscium sp. SCG-C07WGA-EpuloA2]
MELILLTGLFILISFIGNVLFSILINKITLRKIKWKFIYLISLISAIIYGIISNFFPNSTTATYSILTLLYIIHIYVSFAGTIILKLSCAFIIMINFLSILNISKIIMILIPYNNINYIIQQPILLIYVRVISMIVCCIEVMAILKLIKPKYLHLISRKTHSINILFVLTAFLMTILITNSIFFIIEIEAEVTKFLIQQFCFSLCAFGILYTSLFMIIGYEIMEDKKYFFNDNINQSYKAMVVENAMTTIEIDCTRAIIINYSYKGYPQINYIKRHYTDFMMFSISNNIHPEDKKNVCEKTNINYMSQVYKKGINSYNYEYRIYEIEKDDYVWHKAKTSLTEYEYSLIAITVVTNIQKDKDLTFKAECDGLTELYNKITTENIISFYIKQNKEGLMFMIDIDNFKAINDNLGHKIGDIVLKEIAVKLNEIFSDADVIGRIGGDEFIVYFKNYIPDLNDRALNLCKQVTKTYSKDNINITISASVGIASVTEVTLNFNDLYKLADVAMYYSKKHGKNTFTIYENISIKNISVEDILLNKFS